MEKYLQNNFFSAGFYTLTLTQGKKKIWERKFNGYISEEVVSGSLLYFVYERDGDNSDYIYVLNLASGKSVSPIKATKSAPKIYKWDNKVILNADDSLFMLNEGKVQWKVSLSLYSQPEINILSDGTIISTDSNKVIHAIDQNGKEKWKFTDKMYLIGHFTLEGDNTLISAYTNDSKSTPYMISINKDGKKEWETKLPSKFSTIGVAETLKDGTVVITGLNQACKLVKNEFKCVDYHNFAGINQSGKILWSKSFNAGETTAIPSFETDNDSNLYLILTVFKKGRTYLQFHVYRSNGETVYKYENLTYLIDRVIDFKKMYVIGREVKYQKDGDWNKVTGKSYILKLPAVPKKK